VAAFPLKPGKIFIQPPKNALRDLEYVISINNLEAISAQSQAAELQRNLQGNRSGIAGE